MDSKSIVGDNVWVQVPPSAPNDPERQRTLGVVLISEWFRMYTFIKTDHTVCMRFEEVFKIDVNSKTEKKGNLTYLSWAWAWAEFKKVYPDAKYSVKKFDGLPYKKDDGVGAIVYTEVTAGDLTYEMWLPVMDIRNNAILQPKMTDINKTIMRCLTKNLAMFGLGLYIYAGEDLPETDKDFHPITEKELSEFWDVQNVKKTIQWYENQLGLRFDEWGAEECESVRAVLKEQKEKRKQVALKNKRVEG